MGQNGFKMRYLGQDFVAKTVGEMTSMVRSWFEEQVDSMREEGKPETE